MLDEAELVRQFLADEEIAPPDELNRVREELFAAIEVDMLGVSSPGAASVPGSGLPPRRRASRRWVTIAAGVAAAGIAAAVVVPLLLGRSPSAAAQVLDRAAAIAASSTSPVPGPGQFFYTKTVRFRSQPIPEGASGPTLTVKMQQTVQIWATPSGKGREVFTSGPSVPLSAADQRLWESEGEPPLTQEPTLDLTFPLPPGAPHQGTIGATGGTPYVNVSDLPTDPTALRQAIVAKLNGGTDAETFMYAGALLAEGASPALRSAIYEMLAALPGVRALGTITAYNGETTTAIGIVTRDNSNPRLQELLIDPTTTQLVEYRGINTTAVGFGNTPGSPVEPAGLVEFEIDYISSGVVNSTTTVPKAGPT